MKKTIMLLLLSSTISIAVFAQKTNFSGSWTINKNRTDFGIVPQSNIPRLISINQQVNKIILIRTFTDQQFQDLPSVEESLLFDGSSFDYKTATGTPITVNLSWLDDQELTVTRKGTLTATDTWTLEDDGKTLIINPSVEQANGVKYSIKCFTPNHNPASLRSVQITCSLSYD